MKIRDENVLKSINGGQCLVENFLCKIGELGAEVALNAIITIHMKLIQGKKEFHKAGSREEIMNLVMSGMS